MARLAAALLGALAHMDGMRFAELFAGIGRDESARPVAWPNANCPQAWASAAVPMIVRALVGLEVDALARRVTVHPVPLDGASFVRLRDVRVGEGRIAVEVRYDGRRARARIDGVPHGWHARVV